MDSEKRADDSGRLLGSKRVSGSPRPPTPSYVKLVRPSERSEAETIRLAQEWDATAFEHIV